MMSHRGKRQALSRLDDITPVATKRRKGRASATAEEEEASPLEQRPSYSSDIKMSSIYNRSVTDAPAELFRKDLISAMKLPDSEPLTSDHYWVITDQWKQEWERGVQVPVKPDSLPGPVVRSVNTNVNYKKPHLEFKLPKNKYIRITKDEHFRVDEHYLSNVGIQAEKCCAYDLEDVDVVWLNILNGERALLGLLPISQDQLERIIEELEMRCWEKVHAIVKEEEGLALEFDESVICDVCRSPDSEDGNEMVFCDCCNICVHQACYGITSIPSGSWLCRTCNLGLRPECVLCPNKNGAMKSTRSGQKWAHVSCALWIPEVSIGCVERMEPITKISSIPQSRWALICVLCRERVGACIQCSVKTCKTAYHVTCAFKHGLEMRAIIDEESTTDDDNTVKLRSYCQKHSVSCKKESSSVSGSASDEDVKKKQRKDMTTEEKSHARAVKLQEIESEFEKHVTIKDINRKYDVDAEGLEYIYNYWVLKRRAAFNKPLIAARSEDASDLLNKNQEQVDQEKMRMFVQLRQDLERVRNLCYMVSRREKLSRTYQRLREQTFYKQAALLSDTRISLSTAEINSIKEANHGPSIYDRLYSHANAPDLSTDFETMVLRIAGRSESELSPGHSFNGYISGKNGKRFNGDYGKGSSNSGFFESLSSSASEAETKSHPTTMDIESDTHSKVNNCMNKSQRKNSVENRTKNTARRRKKPSPTLVSPLSTDFTSSSEDDDGSSSRKSGSKPSSQKLKKSASISKTTTSAKKKAPVTNSSVDPVQKRFLGRSASISPAEDEDDDESEQERKLLRTKTKSGFISKNTSVSKIYSSDSDSSSSSSVCHSDAEEETKHSDSKKVRTKASMKEFSASGGNVSSNSRTPKDRNGINKSVSFLSSSSSSTASSASKNTNITATEKRRRMDKLFNEETDDEASRKNMDQDDSDNDVFLPQRKPIKTIADRSSAAKSRKNETREKEVKSPLYDSNSKKLVARKDCAKDDVFAFDTSASADKSSQNHNSSSNYDMLTLVPQRAAAKKAIKAIEHMNNGIVKPPTVLDNPEEAIKVSKGIKTTALSSKKEHSHHQQTTTTKSKISADDDTSKVIGPDKRQKSSSASVTTTLSSSTIRSAGSHTSAASSSVTLTTTSSSMASNSSTSLTSRFAANSSTCSATASASSSVVTPAASVAAPVATKKSPTPSSSSSSYSSSSSSSSSSDSSSSGESSSSSNSSSSSGSSSSSSESEGEDEVKPNLTAPKPTPPISAVSSISTSAIRTNSSTGIGKLSSPLTRIATDGDERDVASAKREIEPNSNEKKGNSQMLPHADDREECKPLLSSLQNLTANNEQKSLPGHQPASLSSSVRESLNENYSHTVDDHSSFQETKAAVENLTNDEQNFLSDIWGSTVSVTASSTATNISTSDTTAAIADTNSKNSVMHMIVDDDDDEDDSCEKRSSPLLPALPNRSLFSPQLIKDMDLSPFDDMNENNILADSSNISLLSLSGLNFDGNFSFKENSKEDSARETNKLVEKLKQEMKRKQHSDKLDSVGSAPTPDILLNHIDDDEDTENVHDQMNIDKLGTDEHMKKDDGILLDGGSQRPHQQLQQEPSLMSISSDNSLLLPQSDPSLKIMPNMAAQTFAGSSENAIILPKENPPMSDTLPVPWPSSERRFEDGAQSSPYTQELANAPDRWSESVVLPSRRSDCSSASVSSRSSSSSTYSEPPNQQTSHNDDVGIPRLEQPLELPPHLHNDFLRPAAENLFGSAPTGGSLPDMYSYDEHQLPFVKSAFDPSTSITPDNKSLYTHSGVAPQSVQQSSASLFGASSMSGYDSVAAFSNTSSLMNNAFSQPLSVATASFTTTSQNMAIIASIISPVAPPPLHSDEMSTAATPVSSDSITFEDKSANSSTSDASCTMAPCLEKSVIEEEPPPTPQLPQPVLTPSQPQSSLTQPCPEDDVFSSAEKEKENIFSNVNDVVNHATPATAPSLSPACAPVSIKDAPPSVQSVVTKSPASVSVSPAQLEPVVTKGKTREPSTRKSQRNNNKNASNRRGRGRGRGRGRSRNANCFYRELDDDIHSKLVGTVYDFDDDEDDLPSDNFTNLKAMRERRKSTDTANCDRFSTSSKDTCYSPKFASPSSQHQPASFKRKSSVASTPDRRTSHRVQLSPLCEIGNNVRILPKDVVSRGDSLSAADHDEDDEDEVPEEEDDEEEEPVGEKKSASLAAAATKLDRRASSIGSAATTSPTLPQPPVQSSAADQLAAVQPLLPGPVDMRTYSGDSFDVADTRLPSGFDAAAIKEKAPESANKNSASIADIDEVLSIPVVAPAGGRGSTKNSPAVSASPRLAGDGLKTSAAVAVANHFLAADAVPGDTPSVVMLDDDSQCRNQLKMKIKGPYSNANYVPVTSAVSSVSVAHQQLPAVSHSTIADACLGGAAAATLTTASASSSANLPRMRKKELLLQYCSNINESGNNVVTVTNASGPSAPDAPPIKSGPSYKLPKAVASMTTIPTKEDYKAVLDAAGFIEKKKRGKDKSAAVYDASDISNNNAAAPTFAGGNGVSGHGYHGVHNNKHGARSSSAERKYGADGAQSEQQGADAAHNAYDNHSTKRKSRGNGASSSSTAAHPKLKIKIGGASAVVVQNSVVGAGGASSSSVEEKNLRLRPPKKRLCDPNDMLPSPAFVEQLKRECIRYGSKIRSEFSANGASYDGEYSDTDDHGSNKQSAKEESSRKKRKRSGAIVSPKSSKKKKKQEKSSSRSERPAEEEVVRVITSEIGGEGAPKKLIIKFRGLNPPSEPSASGTSTPPPPPSPAKPPKSSKRNLNHELDSVRTTKITPIRLKFSRSQQGYVSKTTSCAEEESTTTGGDQPKAAATSSSSSSDVANSSLLPNEPAPAATKTAAPSQCAAGGGQGSSADGATAAGNVSATSSTTAAAAVCLSDAA